MTETNSKVGSKRVKITDTILRDAHQSLLATRMRTEDMLPICEKLDEVGFFSLEAWGGATFDSCIRFLNEDPWERLKALKKVIKKTPIQMLLRGQNAIGYRHYADDVVEKFVEKSAENGVDVFRIFDALNDIRNLLTAIKTAKKCGKTVEGTISYTVSPVHNEKVFVEFAKQLRDEGSDIICIKDMAGLLSPYAAFELVSAIRKEISIPIHIHSHCTAGYSPMNYLKAIEAGANIVDCANSAMCMGTAQTSTEAFVATLQGTDYDTGLDLEKLSEITDYFTEVRKHYEEFESKFTGVDINILKSQIPGGMISNMESQLKQQNASDKLHLVLDEVQAVRKDLGYIPLVTPTSQIVGTQATLNVLMGERYKNIAGQTKDIVRGMYGKVPGEISQELKDKVLEGEPAYTERPADKLEPELENARNAEEAKDLIKSEEDLLSYVLFPQVAVTFFKNRGKEVPAETTAKKVSGTGHYQISIDGEAFHVSATEIDSGKITVDGVTYSVDIQETEAGTKPAPSGDSSSSTPVASGESTDVHAPMQGSIFKIIKNVGEKVKEGEVIIILEAMKMETEVNAPCSGKVTSLKMSVGDSVTSGQVLMTIN
ncbi:MAG: sodium-extruding oxaloacetate decarboxylase subunit alpha [Nitrospinae bacterium]|nr:sodium-extruding oxaloacetate decarboxylase subunit alpha [Nitrospinota bacterium]